MSKARKVKRGTVALYWDEKRKVFVTDPLKVLEFYSSVGNIPEHHIGFDRAAQLAFACQQGLGALRAILKKRGGGK